MKVLHLAYCDYGGAGIAAKRLHQSLLEQGVESKMLVLHKNSHDPTIIKYKLSGNLLHRLRRKYRFLVHKFIRRRFNKTRISKYESFSFVDSIFFDKPLKLLEEFDVVNLHWVSEFLDLRYLKKIEQSKKIVWTMHDMYPFTGVCHYAWDCEKYKDMCNGCVQLGSKKFKDLSYRSWQSKKNIYSQAEITFVAPSKWLYDCAWKSGLLKDKQVEHIPYSISLDDWDSCTKEQARELLGLSPKKKYIIAGAVSLSNQRKGMKYTDDFINEILSSDCEDVEILIFGAVQQRKENKKIKYLGILDNDRLKNYYSAADIFIITSLYDNLPCTVLEAMASSCVVAGFDVGGVRDMVDDTISGILVERYDVGTLVLRVVNLLKSNDLLNSYSKASRDKIKTKFSPSKQSESYMRIYGKKYEET